MKPLATLALLLIGVSPAVAAEPAVEPPTAARDSVQLNFAWPVGLKAQVTYSASRTQADASPTPLRWSVRHVIEVQQAGEKLLLRHADFTFDANSRPEILELDPRLVAVLDKASGLNPDYLVTREGAFAGLHDLPEFQTGVRSLLSDLLSRQGSGGLGALVKVATSEDAATAKSSAAWDLIVGYWAGWEMEIGAEYVGGRDAPTGMPGGRVKISTTFAARRRVDCNRGGVPRHCVELEVSSTADSAWDRMPEGFMAEIVGPELSQRAGIRSQQIQDVIRLVTEPDGLIPHSLNQTKTVRSTMYAGDLEETIVRIDRGESTYTYP